MNELPYDILRQFYDYLPLKDKRSFIAISKRINALFSKDYIKDYIGSLQAQNARLTIELKSALTIISDHEINVDKCNICGEYNPYESLIDCNNCHKTMCTDCKRKIRTYCSNCSYGFCCITKCKSCNTAVCYSHLIKEMCEICRNKDFGKAYAASYDDELQKILNRTTRE